VVKSAVDVNGAPLRPGEIVEYTVTLTNVGFDDANMVEMFDPLQPGTTLVPGTLEIVSGPNAGLKTDAQGDDRAEVFNGLSPTGISTQWVAFGLGLGPNNDVGGTLRAAGQPDVAIVKGHSLPFLRGQQSTYEIDVSNAGVISTSGTITVTDTLPAGLTPFAASGPGWTCGIAGQLVTCTFDSTLTPGSAAPRIQIGVDIARTAPNTLTNTATVVGSNDANPTNNGDDDPTTIIGAPDLAIAKSHTGSFTPGQSGTYSLTVTNVGTDPTTGLVTVTDTVPAGLTATAASGARWSCSIAAQTVTCTRSDVLAASASYPPISLTVDVAAQAVGPLVNRVSVTTIGDPSRDNDTAEDSTEIAGTPNLRLTKTHDDVFAPGGTATFTFTAANSGTGSTSGQFTVTDTVPSGLTPTSAVGDGWTCGIGGQTVTCQTTGVIAAGSIAPPITVTVSIPGSASGAFNNTASIAGGGDSDTTDSVASDTLTVQAAAELSVQKSADTLTPAVGQNVTFTIVLSNAGPSTATNVVLRDLLPAGLTLVSATPSQGSYGSGTGDWAVGTVWRARPPG
jgi:uncharacterized repeat protein (TIGR01451 family)